MPNPRPAPRHAGKLGSKRLPRPPSFNEQDVSDKPSFVRSQPRLDPEAIGNLQDRYRDRLRSLLAVDDAVERRVQALRDAGELANTLIIYTSDNGFLLGEHRLRGKQQLYEESVGVPLLMRGPGVPSGAKRTQLVGNIDLAPTIIGAAGATPGRVMDGRSLLPLARRRGEGRGRERLLTIQRSSAVRSPRYMYAEHPDGETELYALHRDPFEVSSRHGDPELASVRSRLAERLHKLERCAGAPCR